MKSTRAKLSGFFSLSIAIAVAGCSSDISTPASPIPTQVSSARSVGALPIEVDYSGVIQPGRHIVCTSKFSVRPGHYKIDIIRAVDGDEWVSDVTVTPGKCAVVFQTTRTSGFPPILTITGGPEAALSSVVRLTPSCAPNRSCVPTCELQELDSFGGSVTKYYFLGPDVSRALMGGKYGIHDPTPCIDFGNHGGIGTEDFAID